MAKKINNLSDLGGFVFSTNKDFEIPSDSNHETTLEPNKQRLEAHLDKKNRGGKVATIIRGFEGTEEDLKVLGKMLKTQCGVGGAVKDNDIIELDATKNSINLMISDEEMKVGILQVKERGGWVAKEFFNGM